MRPDENVPARVPVGGIARDEHQREHGRELDRSHKAERPGTAGAFVELPADGGARDLHAEHRRGATDREGAHDGIAQGSVRIVRGDGHASAW